MYDTNLTVRKVNKKGIISYKGNRYFVGEGFGGEQVGLQIGTDGDTLDVFFCNQKVLTLDPKQQSKY
jgi:putative transposase